MTLFITRCWANPEEVQPLIGQKRIVGLTEIPLVQQGNDCVGQGNTFLANMNWQKKVGRRHWSIALVRRKLRVRFADNHIY